MNSPRSPRDEERRRTIRNGLLVLVVVILSGVFALVECQSQIESPGGHALPAAPNATGPTGRHGGT